MTPTTASDKTPRKRRWVRLALAAVAIVGLSAVACSWWRLETRTPPVSTAQLAPEFSLPDNQGRLVSLDSLLAQGPAVVVFYRGHW